jgi:hypothetical protein
MNIEYKLIKLITKENIITQVAPEEIEGKGYIIFHNPYEIKSFINPQNGEFSTTLIDWLTFSTDNFTKVALNDIITVNEPNEDLVDHYQMILNNRNFNEQTDKEVGTAPLENGVSIDKPEESLQEDFLEMLIKQSNRTIH